MKWLKKIWNNITEKEKDSFWEATLYSERLIIENRQKVEDQFLNLKYKHEIHSAAMHRYNYLLFGSGIYLAPMSKIVLVEHNHREVFPKDFNFYVNQEYLKILNENHTPEEIEQLKDEHAERTIPGYKELFKDLEK